MKCIAPLTAALTLIASQSAALSCRPPDVARTFEQAAQADESYLIMLGTFTFEKPLSPETRDITNPPEVSVTSQFDGEYLTLDGFTVAPQLAVDLQFTCASVWCGSLPSDGATVLAFVEQSDAGYELSIGPCGGQAFREPTAQQIEQVQSCMRGEACEPLEN